MKPLNTMDRTSLDKLPKWASEHIRHIETLLKDVSQELQSRLESAPRSEVAIERVVDMEHPFAFLPAGSTIVIFLDNEHDKNSRDRQAVYLRRAYPHRCEKTGPYHLEVSTGGSGYPNIQPQAANTLRVRVSEEF